MRQEGKDYLRPLTRDRGAQNDHRAAKRLVETNSEVLTKEQSNRKKGISLGKKEKGKMGVTDDGDLLAEPCSWGKL